QRHNPRPDPARDSKGDRRRRRLRRARRSGAQGHREDPRPVRLRRPRADRSDPRHSRALVHPEDITVAGIALLARLDPDGSLPDERDRTARRSLRVGPQGADLMSSLRGDLHPTTRAKLDAILAKWARPGMNNPDDPDSP